jgi:hypothetical protein
MPDVASCLLSLRNNKKTFWKNGSQVCHIFSLFDFILFVLLVFNHKYKSIAANIVCG